MFKDESWWVVQNTSMPFMFVFTYRHFRVQSTEFNWITVLTENLQIQALQKAS